MKALICKQIFGPRSRFVFLEKANEVKSEAPKKAVDEHKKYINKALELKDPGPDAKEIIEQIKDLENVNKAMNRVQAELLAKKLLGTKEDGPETIKQRGILLEAASKKLSEAIKHGGFKAIEDFMRDFYLIDLGGDPVKRVLIKGVVIESGRKKVKYENGAIYSFKRGAKGFIGRGWKKIADINK